MRLYRPQPEFQDLDPLTKGDRILLNKIGQQMAFEQSNFRLWETFHGKALLLKALGEMELEEIEVLRAQKRDHLRLLKLAASDVGAGSHPMAPTVEVATISSMGLAPALDDPRIDFEQCLQLMLVAELVNNEAWRALGDLAEIAGDDEWAERFQQAAAEAEEHLACVRTWIFDRMVDAGLEEEE
ncbi:MAG TPA: hypothetical protein VJR29_00230 [bacterium]|nr:hypothetical protein [bacterium]